MVVDNMVRRSRVSIIRTAAQGLPTPIFSNLMPLMIGGNVRRPQQTAEIEPLGHESHPSQKSLQAHVDGRRRKVNVARGFVDFGYDTLFPRDRKRNREKQLLRTVVGVCKVAGQFCKAARWPGRERCQDGSRCVSWPYHNARFFGWTRINHSRQIFVRWPGVLCRFGDIFFRDGPFSPSGTVN